jgi:alpha-galactosidase
MRKSIAVLPGMLLLSILYLNINAQKFDKLAMTPPMGWNSWNKFACDGIN